MVLETVVCITMVAVIQVLQKSAITKLKKLLGFQRMMCMIWELWRGHYHQSY